eukprot:356347-Chlamydomonas_euryale.AAC.3
MILYSYIVRDQTCMRLNAQTGACDCDCARKWLHVARHARGSFALATVVAEATEQVQLHPHGRTVVCGGPKYACVKADAAHAAEFLQHLGYMSAIGSFGWAWAGRVPTWLDGFRGSSEASHSSQALLHVSVCVASWCCSTQWHP